MKTLIVILFISFQSIAQTAEGVDSILYNEAIANYEIYCAGGEDLNPLDNSSKRNRTSDTDDFYFKSSFTKFKEIIEKHPKSKHYNSALFFVGRFELAKFNYSESKKHLTEFLNTSPSNYEKREAYFDLTEIAIHENEIGTAKQYLEYLNNEKPKAYGCGNEIIRDRNVLKNLNEKLAAKVNKK